MKTVLMDGKSLSFKIKDEIKVRAEEFEKKVGRKISLAVVLVGHNPASEVYVKNKIKACEYVGFNSVACFLEDTVSESEVIEKVKSLASDDKIDGILVQLPLPKGMDEKKVLSFIPPEKDVDGFLPQSIGKLALNEPTSVACTPKGIIAILKEYGIKSAGKNAVVVGRSNIVGKPIAMLLLNENATVTVCHSKTENIASFTKKADIIVCAVGKAKFLTSDMVKKGSVIIDVGINRNEGKIEGDVDFDSMIGKVSHITPVPGGVGPMTIAMLLQNTLELSERKFL